VKLRFVSFRGCIWTLTDIILLFHIHESSFQRCNKLEIDFETIILIHFATAMTLETSDSFEYVFILLCVLFHFRLPHLWKNPILKHLQFCPQRLQRHVVLEQQWFGRRLQLMVGRMQSRRLTKSRLFAIKSLLFGSSWFHRFWTPPTEGTFASRNSCK